MSTDNFIGSTMEGVDAPEVQETVAKQPSQVVRNRTARVVEHTTKGAPTRVVEAQRQNYLEVYYNAPLADANATVIARDAWGRKIEVHASGWEASKNIKRIFNPLELVHLMHGIMAHTLKLGTVYGDEPTYIQTMNTPETIDAWIAHIEKNGVPAKGNDKPGLNAPLAVVIRGERREVTIGTCPVYEIELREEGLTPLRLVTFPDQLVDAKGINGYGIPHAARDIIGEKDIIRNRTGLGAAW